MLKNMINMVKKNYKLYLLFAMIVIIAFLPFIILNKGVMIFPGDSYEQVFKTWQGGHELFRNNQLSQFSWSHGFGANIFSYSFGFLFDPFFYISLIFSKEFIPIFILISVIIQLILGLIITYAWLMKVNMDSKSSIIGACIIVFSGFMFFFLHYYQYTRFVIYYPLILYFSEVFLRNKKFKGLAISIGILGITNYYLLYQFVPFLFIYVLFRYLCINRKVIKIKQLFKDGLLFLWAFAIGVGLSCIVLLPTLYVILSMPRFSTTDIALFDHLSFTQLFKVFTSLFTPVYSRLDANLFVNSSYHASLGWGGGVGIYSLAISTLALPMIFFMKDKFEKGLILGFYTLLIIFLFFVKFSYLFQLTMDTRWLYMFLFLNTFIVSRVLSKREFTNKSLLFSLIFNGFIIILCYLVSCRFQLNTIDNLAILLKILIMNYFIMVIFYLVITKAYNTKTILLVLLLNILLSSCIFFVNNKPVSYKNFDYIYSAETIEKFSDDGFYRVLYDNDIMDNFMISVANDPFAHGFRGASFYSSIYNTNQEEFLNRFKSTWNMPQNQGRNKIYNLLSFKYWYTENHINFVPMGYEFVEKLDNGIEIYENNNFVELGFVYDKTINSSVVEDLPYLLQDRIMQNYLVTDNSLNTQYELNDSIKLLATLPMDTIREYIFDETVVDVNIYIENYGIPNTIVELYNGQNLIEIYDFWQFNYVDFYVDKPIDRIVIKGEDIYGSGTQINLYIEENVKEYPSEFKELTKNSLRNIDFKNDSISANINLDSAGILFTSIPYDKGWKVYMDGNGIDYEKVNFGFIGFNIPKGYHEIEFKYEIPFLNLGVAISIGSILLLVGTDIFMRNRKKE